MCFENLVWGSLGFFTATCVIPGACDLFSLCADDFLIRSFSICLLVEPALTIARTLTVWCSMLHSDRFNVKVFFQEANSEQSARNKSTICSDWKKENYWMIDWVGDWKNVRTKEWINSWLIDYTNALYTEALQRRFASKFVSNGLPWLPGGQLSWLIVVLSMEVCHTITTVFSKTFCTML